MWQPSSAIGFAEFDVEALRERLQKMTDDQLVKFGKAAAYMCSPKVNRGRPPREEFVIQLQEARAEWRRRHPRSEANPAAKLGSIRSEDSPRRITQRDQR